MRASTVWEFFTKLIAFRFGRTLARWRKSHEALPEGSLTVAKVR